MNGDIRVAIIGCGTIARRAHLPAWLAIPGSHVVALCDPVEEAARQMASRHGLKTMVFRTLDDLLDRVKPDVVDVCTSSPHHYPLAEQALEAGCNVLLEKPPVHTIEQAKELAALARRRGAKLGCVLNYRYRDLVLQLKEASDNGLLGRIVKISSCTTAH